MSRSSDDGATWTTSTAVAFPDPTGMGFFAGDVDNRLYVDHSTGRLFYYDYDSGNVGAQPGRLWERSGCDDLLQR